jgi:hypothetical protein|tara:strand:+ start:1476 stop:1796 length:321 start_codon:yes stop_codon:yes gene_type:complete
MQETLSQKQKSTNKNRFVITTVVLITFMVIMFGIGLALFNQAPMSGEWKETLFLVLGAFIASYGKIIDFWFNASDDDGIPGYTAPPATEIGEGPNYCDNCGDSIEY